MPGHYVQIKPSTKLEVHNSSQHCLLEENSGNVQQKFGKAQIVTFQICEQTQTYKQTHHCNTFTLLPGSNVIIKKTVKYSLPTFAHILLQPGTSDIKLYNWFWNSITWPLMKVQDDFLRRWAAVLRVLQNVHNTSGNLQAKVLVQFTNDQNSSKIRT